MNVERPSERVSMRSSSYDFERLQRSVEHLLEDHERLSVEREVLRDELLERERRIAVLESKLASEGARRASAVASVDRVLERLQALELEVVEGGLAAASEAR